MSYSDLDLSDANGEKQLQERIRNTAHEACQQLDQLYPVNGADQLSVDRRCVDEAVDSATTQSTAAVTAARQAVYAAEIRVNDAVIALGKLKDDPRFSRTLRRAEGIVIVPQASRAQYSGRESGCAGVLLTRRHGSWSNPAFYRVGAGGKVSQTACDRETSALLLMNRKAVTAFETHRGSWDPMSQAGLNVLPQSATSSRSTGKSDLVEWTRSPKANGAVAGRVNTVSWDEGANRAYYGTSQLTLRQILDADISNPHKSNANLLRGVLPLRVAAR